MKRTPLSFTGLLVSTSLILALLIPSAFSAETCPQWAGQIVSIQGTVEVKNVGEAGWHPAQLNETCCPGDTIRVFDHSRADIALINQPVLRLDQNTTVILGGVKEDRSSIVELVKGAAHFFSRMPRSLGVITGFVNAGVEGTEFFVRVDESQTFITIFEGKVLASNQSGSLAITSGQSAVAQAGRAPELRTVVRPRDAVQWTLYYPPVLDYGPSDFKNLSETDQATLKKSMEAYGKGDFTAAFESLQGVPERANDPRLYVYHASVLLGVGRVEEAKADIDKALGMAPNHGDALSLQSVIAVTQNEKEKALTLAKKAVEGDSKSASARIALSYAQQANFDLEGARNSLKEAVQLEPENALAWARLSELWLSFGERDEALKAAQKAAALNPSLSRTQTVLGFAYLTQVKTRESKEAFEKAIQSDQGDPLPRLGLGLARIRDGDLANGRKEVEIAASLDPNNSLIRSYLGKAYYEEKQEKLSSDQYKMAKEFDPMDPTPLFYDAILKQTTNRPVEALHDLQQAIELNDNRAVYRSKQMLDEDLAARSAALARVYTDLGFQQRALVEGWKSVNTDPSDFSGHRFLADTYAALPRHEIARVSELLQSQLLQPLNMTPIQPRLAESNLFLISSGGPGSLSFNEFNPLFNRDGITFQGSGLLGENDTWGAEGVLSGIYKKASFSVGYSHFETDGWRENADQDDDIVNAFVQVELTPETSIQGEFRSRDSERGDLRLRFFEDDIFNTERTEEDGESYRFGFRQAWSPSSITLGSFAYHHQDRSTKFGQDDVAFPLTSFDAEHPDEDAYSAEVQHLFRSQYVDIIGGAGYFNIDSEFEVTVRTIFAPPFDVDQSNIDQDIKHFNIYAYSYIKPLENLTFTVGASGDFIRPDNEETFLESKDEFNPKLGITWNPFPSTTVRGAAFKVTKRTLIVDQTLEPTQVAGFNQFFDDFDGTEAWRYGGAVDQKFTQDIYGGAEFAYRDLEIPFIQEDVIGNPVKQEEDAKEYEGRAYLFWTPHKWLALRAEYQYERFESEGLTDLPKNVETNRFPLGVNFFHPCGLSASLTTTYYDQDGKFVRLDGSIEKGDDTFWLVDAAINYRLPKRYGFITVGVRNLFDEEFRYYDTDFNNPAIQPDRFFFGKITLALP